MQVFAAGSPAVSRASPETPSATMSGKNSRSLLLTESARAIGGPPSLLESLSQAEREIVLKRGRRKVFYRGQTLFNQGTKHDGIYLIETGRIRVFYTAPSQREITLAYWLPATSSAGRRFSAAACTSGRASPATTAASFSCRARSCGSLSWKFRISRSA